jgi:hypothetical protein
VDQNVLLEKEREKLQKITAKMQSDIQRLLSFKRAILNTFNEERERNEVQSILTDGNTLGLRTHSKKKSESESESVGEDGKKMDLEG